MLGTNTDNVVENTEEEPKKESTLCDGDDAPGRKKQRQSNDKIEILDDMSKENKEMIKMIKDQHERRMQNEEREIEVMTQLVEAIKKQ